MMPGPASAQPPLGGMGGVPLGGPTAAESLSASLGSAVAGSCGQSHDLHAAHQLHEECLSALSHIDEYVDGEITMADHDAIAEHLRACPPCMQQFALEQMLKLRVARSCADHAPPTLRAKVIAHLSMIRVQDLHPE